MLIGMGHKFMKKSICGLFFLILFTNVHALQNPNCFVAWNIRQRVSSKLESPVFLPLEVIKKGETVNPISCPSMQNGFVEITLVSTCCLTVVFFKMRKEKSNDSLRLVDYSRMTGTLKIKPNTKQKKPLGFCLTR